MIKFKVGDIIRWGARKDYWEILILKPCQSAGIICVQEDNSGRMPHHKLGETYDYVDISGCNKIKSSDSPNHPLTNIFK